MSKTAVAEIISKAVENSIAPLLRENGYRRNGTHYYKSELGIIKVLNVQSSQWNTAQEARFTINLGVHLQALADRRPPMPDPPREEFCLLRERIGMLLPENRDHWWTVTPATDPAQLAEHLRAICKDRALPWLDGHGDMRRIAEELERKKLDWDSAAAWMLLGEAPRATQLIRQSLEQCHRHLAEYSDMDELQKRFPKSDRAKLDKVAASERTRIHQNIEGLRAWAKERNLEI